MLFFSCCPIQKIPICHFSFISLKTVALCWNHCISNQRWRICPYFSIWDWLASETEENAIPCLVLALHPLRLDCKVVATWWALLKSQIVFLEKRNKFCQCTCKYWKKRTFHIQCSYLKMFKYAFHCKKYGY